MADAKKLVAKKKVKRTVPSANVYVKAGYNNTIVSVTDPDGMTLSWSSSGSSGFRGSKKSTPYAAQMASENAISKAKVYGIEKVTVFINGVGPGREQAIRGLHLAGMDILTIIDKTSVPHGGCRAKNPRKV